MASTTSRRILSFIAGIILIFAGGYVFYNPVFVPALITVVGIFLLVAGILYTIDVARLPSGFALRNSWLVDGVLMLLVGLALTFLPAVFTITVLGYTLLIWFVVTAILQIVVAKNFENGALKWLIIILSLIVIVLSVYGFFSPGFAWGLLYLVIAFEFIFLGVLRLLATFAIK